MWARAVQRVAGRGTGLSRRGVASVSVPASAAVPQVSTSSSDSSSWSPEDLARSKGSYPEDANNVIEMKGMVLKGMPLYLDMQATTPLDPRVLDAMLPYQTSQFGNPHSRTHVYGWETEEAVETARGKVAKLVGADPREIVFTSGATESNNLAVKGVAGFYGARKRHLVASQTEHKCVLDSMRRLETEEHGDKFRVTYLPVEKGTGLVRLEELEQVLVANPDTSLVSIMAVNNEIGVLQPLKEIAALCKKHGALFHTDAAQMVGKMPIDVNDLGVDLMSISGHKIYGPKGVGALYVRRRPRVRLAAQMSGGGQERGLRSGTAATPLIVGLGAACDLAAQEMARDHAHVSKLAERMLRGLRAAIPDCVLNGSEKSHYPGCVNVSFPHVEGESLLMGLKQIAVSSGSACTSASLEPSYVLRALGVSDDLAHTSIRFGLGRFTTEAEVDFAVSQTIEVVERLRAMSPLYEMMQDGIDITKINWTQH